MAKIDIVINIDNKQIIYNIIYYMIYPISSQVVGDNIEQLLDELKVDVLNKLGNNLGLIEIKKLGNYPNLWLQYKFYNNTTNVWVTKKVKIYNFNMCGDLGIQYGFLVNFKIEVD